MSSYIGKIVHVRSAYNLYLGVTPSHQLYAHQNRCGWERVRLGGTTDNATLGGWQDWYIGTDASSSGNVFITQNDSQPATRWEIINIGSMYQFKSKATGRFLTLGTNFWNRPVTTVAGQGDALPTYGLGTFFSITEPNDVDFMFETAGVPCGLVGMNINVPTKQPGLTWGDNFICSTVGKPPMVWCYNQQQVANYLKQGFTFMPIKIAGDPIFKDSVGLCLPKASPYDWKFVLTDAEAPALIQQGYILTQFQELADPTMNASMWLAYKRKTPSFASADQIAFRLQIWSGGWANDLCTTNKARIGRFKVDINSTTVISNSSSPWRSSRGVNMAVIDQTGKLLYHKAYDTCGSASQSDLFASELGTQSSNIKDDRIIVVGTFDEGAAQLNDAARDIMMLKGAGEFSTLGYRGSYLFVFRPRDNTVFFEKQNNCGDVTALFDCGVKCAPIFDQNYYSKSFGDASADPINHWTNVGIKEGRQGHPAFDPKAYYSLNDDLQDQFGMDYTKLAMHYMSSGKAEGRAATIYKPEYKFGGILSNNLTCFLDSGNKSSFDGSTVWKDLSGNNNNFTFTKPPVSDGITVCDVPQLNGPPSTSLKIGADSNRGSYTISMVVRCKSAVPSLAFFIPRADGERAISSHMPWEDKTVYFDNMVSDRVSASIADSWDKEHMITLVRTLSGRQDIYIDGKRVSKGPTTKTVAPAVGGSVTINNDSKWRGDLKMFIVYNYGLPSDQIKGIYDWYMKTVAERELAADVIGKGPKGFPVLRGLQILLSSTNKDSFTPNTVLVKDLSGHGRDFKFNKIPIFKDMCWVNDGTNMLVGPPSSTAGIKSDGNYTIFFRCKTNLIGQNSVLKFYGWGVADRAIFIHPTWDNRTIYYDQGGCCGPETRLYYPVANALDKMTTYTIMRDDSGRSLFVNGKLVISTKDRGTDMHFHSDTIKLMGSTEYQWQGAFSDLVVFNRGLNHNELKKIYRYINNPYILTDTDWNGAAQLCINQGMQLANMKELCFGGAAVDASPFENALAPIGDRHGKWVNLSTCQTQDAGKVINTHIKCVPMPKITSNFNTAFMIDDTTAWFIRDNLVLTYNLETHITLDPTNIATMLPGLQAPFNEGKIDATYLYRSKGVLYLVHEQIAAKYDIKNKKPIGDPGDIKQVFPGLKDYFGEGFIDAIVEHYTEQNAVYFFKSNKFSYYNLDTDHAGGTYDIDSKPASWNMLPVTFKSGNFSAVIKNGPVFYFFKEDQYFNYAVRYHGNLVPDWPGMKPPFITEQQRCTSIAKYKPKLTEKAESYRNQNPELFKVYSDRLSAVNDEESKHCNFVSMDNMKDRLKKEKKRFSKLLEDITNARDMQRQTSSETKELTEQIKQIESQIADLDIRIGQEKAKTCPKDQTCTKPHINATKKGSCDTGMIKELLRNKGYIADQIAHLEDALAYKPSINDYDIRTHPNHHKYVDLTKINKCRDGLADPDVARAGRSNENGQKTLSADEIASQYEKKAFEVLKTAILEYGRSSGLNNGEIAGASSVDDLSKATTSMIPNANNSQQLSVLKQIQGTLTGIKAHPKYKQLTNDIAQLSAQHASDNKALCATTVPEKVAALKERIAATKAALKDKSTQLEQFTSLKSTGR